MRATTTATIHQLDGPNGQPIAALFTGPGGEAAAWRWAAVLFGQREVLARRGAEWRKNRQQTAWRKARGKDVGAKEELAG